MTTHSFIASLVALPIAIGVGSLAAMSGQTRSEPAKKTTARSPYGPRDLQGYWTNATLTPLERPGEFAGKEFFTEKEAAAYEKQARERNNADRRDDNAEADLAVGYNAIWWDRGTNIV